MYCTTCGKQIIDTARFCNYCGSPVVGAAFASDTANVSSAPGTPKETAPVSAPLTESVSAADNTVSDNPVGDNEAFTQPENTAYAPSSDNYEENPSFGRQDGGDNEALGQAPSENAQTEAARPPVFENVSGTQAESTYRLPAPNPIPIRGEGAAKTAERPAKPLPERKYTIGHIVMCLCAVALMAIVAGVFAGLYFSVV